MTDNQSVLLVNSPICRLCQKVYQNPKILSCLHSYCCMCLQQLHRTDNNYVMCPVCNVETSLPPGGIINLTTNSFLNRISKDYIETIKSSIRKKSTDSFQHDIHANRVTQSNSVDRSSEVDSADDAKLETCKVSEKLRSELQHLQGEALRMTYSLEMVTDIVTNWKTHTVELKNQIQQRSALLQHIIQRHEKQLISQLTNQEYTDQFEEDIESAKCGLKQNLKNTIQAIEFIKQVQEFATEEDILNMQEFLLKELATLNKVSINYKKYSADFEDVTDVLGEHFGHLSSLHIQDVVFEPKQSGEATEAQDHQQKSDETSVPKWLQFRRKKNKERRLTSVVDKNWRADESKQTKSLSYLRENLVQRRRHLLQEYNSFESGKVYMHQREIQEKKKKRKYHSFGGRSAMSVAPPDAATLKEVSDYMQITPHDLPSEETALAEIAVTNTEEKEYKLHTDDINHSHTCDTLNQTNKESEADDKNTEEEWTVVTEEVVVQQPSPHHTAHDAVSFTEQTWRHSTDPVRTEEDNTSDCEWVVTVEEVSVEQQHQTDIRSSSRTDPDKSNFKSESSNCELHRVNRGDKSADSCSLGEWTVTTEEVCVPTDSFIRSSVAHEDRETRLKFLMNNWKKRKDVLKQTEGFVAPTTAERKPSNSLSAEEHKDSTNNLSVNIRTLLEEEKNRSAAQDTEEETHGDSQLGDKHSSSLTKDRLNEYRKNMREKAQRWRISST